MTKHNRFLELLTLTLWFATSIILMSMMYFIITSIEDIGVFQNLMVFMLFVIFSFVTITKLLIDTCLIFTLIS